MATHASATPHEKMSNSEAAELTKFIGIVLGGAAAVAGALSWNFSRIASQESKAALAKYKQEAGVKISEANALADGAKKDAAVANAEAAKANLELEKMKERERPRFIPKEKRDLIVALLKTVEKRPITILSESTRLETQQFSEQLAGVFKSADFKDVEEMLDVGGSVTLKNHSSPPEPWLLVFAIKSDPGQTVIPEKMLGILKAFHAADIKPVTMRNESKNEFVIWVGSK